VVPRIDEPVGSSVRVRVRARDVAVALAAPEGTSIRNALRGHVRSIAAEAGPFAELTVDLGGPLLRARVTRRSADELGLRPGLPLVALVRAVAVERRLLTPLSPGVP
jgi:molybdate transport system ATP-binding protein